MRCRTLVAIGLFLALAAAPAASRAAVITVGPGGTYSTIAAAVAAAQANDDIRVQAGTYTNDFATITIPLTIEGVGGTPILLATQLIPNGKAILITRADVTITNLEFSGARVTDGNGAGIRYEAGDLIVTSSIFSHNQDGILAAADPNGTVAIHSSTFIDNGTGDGFTHAVYISAVGRATITDSNFQGTAVGHDIKSRALETIITGNILDDGVTGTTSYAIDLSNGGVATISNNQINQGQNTQNPTMISYGSEGNLPGSNSLLVSGNTFSNTLRSGSIGVFNHTDVLADLRCNTFNNVATPLLGPGTITASGCAATAIPEPAGLALLGPALLGLAFFGRRRRRARSAADPG
jgi:hypothetical protein